MPRCDRMMMMMMGDSKRSWVEVAGKLFLEIYRHEGSPRLGIVL